MLHDQRAGDVAACRRLVMGGCGDGGVGGVRSLVLALTAQGEGVVAGDVRAWISSLSGRWTVCLHLVGVCGVHMGLCVCVSQ